MVKGTGEKLGGGSKETGDGRQEWGDDPELLLLTS